MPSAVKIRTISDLTPDSKNANKGTKRGREMLSASIEKYGVGRSILVDRAGRVIAGNKTLKAVAKNGTKIRVVPTKGKELVVVQRTDLDLDSKEARELAVADNRVGELGLDWDADVLKDLDVDLSQFFKDIELKGLGIEVAEPEAPEPKLDQAAALQKKWKTKRGQIWEIGRHRLMCGDCTSRDLVQLMDGNRADCVFTSPPYAVGIEYGEYVDSIDNLRKMLPTLARTWMEIVEPGGFAVINFGDIVSGQKIAGSRTPCEYPMALEYWGPFREKGWTLWSRRIWCKPGAAVGSSRHCIRTNRAASNFEHIWTWKSPGDSIIDDQTTGEYASQNGWFDSTHGVHLAVGLSTHGAGMPILPAKFSISNHAREGRIVLEPFSGTGTSICASEQLGRICYAMEIEPKYVAVALERLHEMGLKPKLLP